MAVGVDNYAGVFECFRITLTEDNLYLKRGQKLRIPLIVDKIQFKLSVYPNGKSNGKHQSQRKQCALYLSAWRASETDGRTIELKAMVQTDDQFNFPIKKKYQGLRSASRTISSFRKERVGFENFCSIKQLRKWGRIMLEFLIRPTLFRLYKSVAIDPREQKINFYNNMIQHGDVVLYPSTLPDTSPEPPVKKRKLNSCDALHLTNSEKKQKTKNYVRASSLVLISSSRVFKAILAHKKKDEKKKINIATNNMVDIDDMMYFLVVGELRKTMNLINLVYLAHFYELDSLFNHSLGKLCHELNMDNFFDVFRIFDRFGILNGYNELLDFVSLNKDQIRNHSRYCELPYDRDLSMVLLDNKTNG